MDDNSFVDSLITAAGNDPAGNAPAEKQPSTPSAQKPAKAAPAAASQPQGESVDGGADPYAGMTPEQREEAEQAEIDNATPEQRKAWDKKFVNALSRREKDKNRLKGENEQLKAQLAALSKAAPQPGAQPGKPAAAAPGVKAYPLVDTGEKPDVNAEKYKGNYGLYLEEVAQYNAKVIANEIIGNFVQNQQKQADETKTQAQKQAEIAKTETKIMQEAAAYIEKNPEALNVVQANADILDSYPPHIVEVIAGMDNALVAINELAKLDGALEKLGKMSPANAAITLGMAYAAATGNTAEAQTDGEGAEAGANAEPETQTQQQPKKPVSSAPVPMKVTPSTPGGKKQLHQMDADEIMKTLDIRS